MRRNVYVALLTALALCFCFAACAAEEPVQTETTTAAQITTQPQSTTEYSTSTTAQPKADAEKSKKLLAAAQAQFEEAVQAEADETGGFTLTVEQTDAAQMYAMEYSDAMQKNAEDNAAAFVKTIAAYYPDELTYVRTEVQPIGGTGEADNGIDSALYTVFYTNSQSQTLELHADSGGSLYYIACDFTW